MYWMHFNDIKRGIQNQKNSEIHEKFMKIHSKKLKSKTIAIFDWCELHCEAKRAPF